MKIKCSYTNLVDVQQLLLIQNPKNNNKHPKEQIERLSKIIEFQGQRSPIVISKRSGFIIKGHARLMAIVLLGWEKAAVDYQDYNTEAEEYADMTADNEIARWAEFDTEKFLEDIKTIDLGDIDLFGIQDTEQLLKSIGLNEHTKEIKNTNQELEQSDFQNFSNVCPKCGFEWNN